MQIEDKVLFKLEIILIINYIICYALLQINRVIIKEIIQSLYKSSIKDYILNGKGFSIFIKYY